MKIAILLVMILSLGQQEAQQKRYIALNRLWQEIHAEAFREQIDPNASLVIDPSKSAIWIDRDVQPSPNEIEKLPSGLEWSAYHVTDKGIREIAFPIRLLRPRLESEDATASETIFVFGFGKEHDWRLSFTPTPDGNAFYAGSGSKFTSMSVRLPAIHDRGRADAHADSILEPNGLNPNPEKWSDTIQSKSLTITVDRTNKAE